jgi:hypothetical protein
MRSMSFAQSLVGIACGASPPFHVSIFFAGVLRLRCSRELTAAKMRWPDYESVRSLN